METYPIVIDGAPAGTLRVEQRGALRQFDADCAMRPDLVRLSVYGGGREGYLGVLAPEGDRLTLHRAMSRAQLRGFPAEIQRVERAGLPPEQPRESAAPSETPHEAETAEAELSEAEAAAEAVEEPAAAAEAGTGGAAETEPCPATEEASGPAEPETAGDTWSWSGAVGGADPEDPEDLRWYSSPDGALVCFDGIHSLIALPEGDERVPASPPGEMRSIEGRTYLVYQTRNGRIVTHGSLPQKGAVGEAD